MQKEDEILINMFGQSLIEINQLTEKFNYLNLLQKKQFLNDVIFLILQSKPINQDIETSILNSKLNPNFTPCVMLRKSVSNDNLVKLLDLPETELKKVFILLLHLFKISYKRRFEIEKGNPDKWWYWDLSNIDIVKLV